MVNCPDPLNGGCYLGPTNSFVPFTKTELEQSISDRFEQQVNLYPERSAIRNRGKTISYRSLNGMANRVARALLQSCGEKQKPIGLLLENGEAVIAAVLGVLKSGNIYVPLDPISAPSKNGVYSPGFPGGSYRDEQQVSLPGTRVG